MRWQRDRQGPGSNPRGPTWRSRLLTWRPEPPPRRPRRPTWRPRRPNLAFRGRSKRVPVPTRAGPECPSRPKSKFHRFFIDFRLIFRSLCTAFGLCQALLLCSADSVRLTKRRRKTHGYRFRLAFGCSSLPVRVPRSNPQLASQRFTRCSKVSAPSYVINAYRRSSSSSSSSNSSPSSSRDTLANFFKMFKSI